MPPVRTNDAQLAEPAGATVVRGRALEQFELAPSDLDSVLPVSRADGVLGQRYNLRDVEALAARLRAAWADVEDTADASGEQIGYEEALEQLQLHPSQLRRIRATALQETSGGMMPRTYNLRDVRTLSVAIEAAAAAPSTPQPPQPVQPRTRARGAEEDEVFANDDDSESDLSSGDEQTCVDEEDEDEDAADLEFEMTYSMGCVGPFTFGEPEEEDFDDHEHVHEHGHDDDGYYDDEYSHECEVGFYDNMDPWEAEAHFNGILHG